MPKVLTEEYIMFLEYEVLEGGKEQLTVPTSVVKRERFEQFAA